MAPDSSRQTIWITLNPKEIHIPMRTNHSLTGTSLRGLVLCTSMLACHGVRAQNSVADSIPHIKAAQVSFALAENEIEFTPGRLVAVVGEDHVLAAEVLSMLEARLAEGMKNATPQQIDAARNQYFRPMLTEVIKMKMYSQSFLAQAAGNKSMKDREDAKQQIKMKVAQAFHESYVPILLKQYKVESELELDRALREKRSSLEGQKLTFMDSVLADEFVKGAVPNEVRVDILEIRDRYEEEKDQWQRPARVRFQKMSVLFKKYPDKNAAYSEIVSMFEEVRTGGAPFSSVAARRSQGAKAEEGGFFDWTNQGSLRSQPVEQAIFSIPTNRLSDIIEDSDGFHVVVVLEREDARILPFAKAQEEIRKDLEHEKKVSLQRELFDDLQKKTPVFSAWPADWPTARPLSEYNGIALEQ
jgi:parvulin-like peptidyl-prolyl isomerase